MFMKKSISAFLNDEAGATLIEYGLIAALVSIAVIGAASQLGGKLSTTFNNVNSQLK